MSLVDELLSGLDEGGARLHAEVIAGFGDLYWDQVDILALEPAARLESRSGPREFVVQRVCGELRYWATSDGRPFHNEDAPFEIGTMASIADVQEFCRAFLVRGQELSKVVVRRQILRVWPR